MPVQVAWYDAPHVIVTFWSGDATLEDVQHAVNAVHALMNEAQAPVILLNDTADVTKPYMNMGLLRSTARPLLEDERVSWMVAYHVQRPLVNFLVMFVARTFSLKTRSFKSWENAQAFLQSLDTDLDFSRTPAPPVNSS